MASGIVTAPILPNLSITSPLLRAQFFISQDAVWPPVVFQTDAVLASGEQLRWNWSISWGHFLQKGVAHTETAWWDAQDAITNLGGLLNVVATRNSGLKASSSVIILGKQPAAADISSYLAAQENSAGFQKILAHESAMTHFDASGNPLRSFDGGYGIAQLTNPKPTYEQAWNWKRNIDGALSLFAAKRNEAKLYLSHQGTFTDDQLLRETVSRWNGGSYHIWNSQIGWVRKPTVLCDPATGNIGWDMTDDANKGKTKDELHNRDKAFYSRPPREDDAWGYFGVCYADSVLGP